LNPDSHPHHAAGETSMLPSWTFVNSPLQLGYASVILLFLYSQCRLHTTENDRRTPQFPGRCRHPHLARLDAAATPTSHAWIPQPRASRNTRGAAEGTAPCFLRLGVFQYASPKNAGAGLPIDRYGRSGQGVSRRTRVPAYNKHRHLHRRAAISVDCRSHRFQKSDVMLKLASMWRGEHLMSLRWFPL
jgi:hypothetical protein